MYQKLILVGNLGRDPEMRATPSGTQVTNFSIATNRQYTGSDGKKVKETCWVNVATWGRQAETCNQYLRKGSKVLVEGRLNPDENGGPRIWTGTDGQPRASYEMTALTVQFLDPAGNATGEATSDIDPEDIPF